MSFVPHVWALLSQVSSVVGVVIVAAMAGVSHGHWAQDPPTGQILYDVPCLSDASTTYTLYLPKRYTPDRTWPLLMGFHYNGEGLAIVEKYRAAAEEYGYILAASNSSRNGSWAVSSKVAQAMANDVVSRLEVDPARIYLTGLSGGARLSIQIAMANKQIAGVIASSAGYPDSQPRTSLPFPIFATVGTFDFNYMEMRTLSQTLKTPHRLVIFDGGHVLPPDDVATRAIEWMELQAMARGLQEKDDTFVDRLWQRREREIEATGESAATVHALRAAADDFRKLRDVSDVAARADALAKRKDIKAALEQERKNDLAETDLINTFINYEIGLVDPARRAESLMALRSLLNDLRRRAGAIVDSPDRLRARRVLEVVSYYPALRVSDQEYLALLQRPIPR